MILTDPISNLFSKIKNGVLSKKTKITHEQSKLSINILNILLKEGFIKSYKINSKKQIHIFLKYKKNQPVFTDIQRISKPSKRVYIKNKDIFFKKNGFFIISSSTGILSHLDAKKLNVGGELICKIT